MAAERRKVCVFRINSFIAHGQPGQPADHSDTSLFSISVMFFPLKHNQWGKKKVISC